MRRKEQSIRPAIFVLTAIVASFLFSAPSGAADVAELFEEGRSDPGNQDSLVVSDGKWAREYANEMLERFPKLQTNPYAVLVGFSPESTNDEINELLNEIGAGVVEHFFVSHTENIWFMSKHNSIVSFPILRTVQKIGNLKKWKSLFLMKNVYEY